VTISGLTMENNSFGDYQLPTPQATAAANITPFILPVTGITADGRVYDNNTDATMQTGSASTNFFAADNDGTTLNLSGIAATLSDKHAGVHPVTISGLMLNNNGFGDYQLPAPQEVTTIDITPFTLTVTGITAESRPYDNNTDATIDAASAAANFFLGDDDGTKLNASGAVGTFSDKHVGTGKTVTISGLTLDNNSFGDYQLPTPQATTAANITAFVLTVTGITAANKRYDGTTRAELNTHDASANFFATDTVTLDAGAAIGTFDTKDAGDMRSVTISGLTLAGNSSGDYQFASPQDTTTASIARSKTAVQLVPRGVFKNGKILTFDLTATVKPQHPGGGTPTGTALFEIITKTKKRTTLEVLGRTTLRGGHATLSLKATLVVGKAITVVYSGDANFAASQATSPELAVAVRPDRVMLLL
jgi:hypothetical protein